MLEVLPDIAKAQGSCATNMLCHVSTTTSVALAVGKGSLISLVSHKSGKVISREGVLA